MSAEQFNLLAECPTPHMIEAWLSCLQWSITHEPTISAFRAETGNTWTPSFAPMDRIVDNACGAPEKFVRQYVAWFNENVWGTGNEDTDK